MATATRPASPLSVAIREVRSQMRALGLSQKDTHHMLGVLLACRAQFVRGAA